MMAFSSDKFSELLPEKLKKIEYYFLENNIAFMFVGGVVRDFLLKGSLSKDIDIEVSPLTSDHASSWPNSLYSLLDSFSEFPIKYEKLPFSIARVSFENAELEISPARSEIYDYSQINGHSDFQVTYIKEYLPEESLMRRDFTINSIGLIKRNNKYQLVDPFFGYQDLKDSILKFKNPAFYQDPVRLLRLIRFSQRFNFKISQDIDYSYFNLSKLSFYHLKKESDKASWSSFISTFISIVEKFKISKPKWLDELFAKFSSERVRSSSSFEEVFIRSCFEERNEEAVFLCELLQIKKRKVKELMQLKNMILNRESNEKIVQLFKKIGLSPSTYPEGCSITQSLNSIID